MLFTVLTPILKMYSPTFLRVFILLFPIPPSLVIAIFSGFSHHPSLALELTEQNPTLSFLGNQLSLVIVIVLLLY